MHGVGIHVRNKGLLNTRILSILVFGSKEFGKTQEF